MNLPVAQQLPWDRFEFIFSAAVLQQDSRLLDLIRGMPAQAAQMGVENVVAAAEVAAKLKIAWAFKQCLAHPAVTAIQPAHVRQLLKAVLQLCSGMPTFVGPLEALLSMHATQ